MESYDSRVRIYRAQHDKDNPYFLMRRDTAQDDRLSFEARGMLAYLLSKPSDWMLVVSDLMRAGQCGRDRVRRILRELLDKGYAVRTVQRDEDGRYSTVDYAVYESPQTEKPSPDNPALDNPLLQSTEENRVIDKKTLTEKTVNGTRPEKTEQNTALNSADTADKKGNVRAKKSDRIAKAPRPRDEVWDAITTQIFRLPLDGVKDPRTNARIGKLRKFLMDTDANYMREMPVTPRHIHEFAQWYRTQHPKISLPLDVTKFAQYWVQWRSGLSSSSHQESGLKPVLMDTLATQTEADLAEALKHIPF